MEYLYYHGCRYEASQLKLAGGFWVDQWTEIADTWVVQITPELVLQPQLMPDESCLNLLDSIAGDGL